MWRTGVLTFDGNVKLSSTLQVTSYNISGADTVAEKCVGVVKAPSGLHPKNACQHAEDLKMLETREVLFAVFNNLSTNEPKTVDAIEWMVQEMKAQATRKSSINGQKSTF